MILANSINEKAANQEELLRQREIEEEVENTIEQHIREKQELAEKLEAVITEKNKEIEKLKKLLEEKEK